MKKSTKRIVSMMLAASMMFTTVAANPSFAFAAADEVTAYEVFTGSVTLDMAALNAEHANDWLGSTIDGDYLGGGLSVVTKGSAFEFKGAWNQKEGTPGVFSDGTSCAERWQIGKGNAAIAADIAVGGTVDSVEKALKLEAGSAGTVTLYADAGSTVGATFDGNYEIILVDTATNTVVEAVAKVKDGSLVPTTLNIPAAGTYYILSPGNVTSINVGAIKVELSGAPVDTTTESTTVETTTEVTTAETTTEVTTAETTTEVTTVETTTEVTTVETTVETTTEVSYEVEEDPAYAEDAIAVRPVSPQAVVQSGANVVDKTTYQSFTVNIDLSQVEAFAASNDGNGINNYTFFVSYDPSVVKMTGVVEKDTKFVTYDQSIAGMTIPTPLYDKGKIAGSIALVPGADDPDYTDVAADGVKTCAELGKVKFANVINATSEDGKTLLTATNSGAIVALSFDVVGTGNTKLAVDVSSNRVDGFKSNPTSTKTPVCVALPSNLYVGDVKEETTTETTTVETTTETTTVETTTEITTVETSTVVSTEDTTAPTEETTVESTTAETTTEATTIAPTTEATTEVTTETEETTKKRTSGGGGGGGSSSHKASKDNPDVGGGNDEGTDTPDDNNPVTPSTPDKKPSFTITNNNGKDVVIAPPMNADKNVSFVDVASRPWATDAINKLAKLGIVNGVSEANFAPDAYSKRADFVIMIVNTLGITGTATSNFDDVYAGKYYYNAVGLGYEAGIVEGYGDGTFGPEKYCTREEMMVLVAQTFKFLGEDITASESVLDKYADKDAISWWAKPYVAYLTEAGVATGTGANLEPSVYITRAQMAVMIEKVYNKVVDMAEEALAAAEAEAEETTEATTEDVTSEETTSEDETAEDTTSEETTAEETTEATTEAE